MSYAHTVYKSGMKQVRYSTDISTEGIEEYCIAKLAAKTCKNQAL